MHICTKRDPKKIRKNVVKSGSTGDWVRTGQRVGMDKRVV